MSVRLFLDTNRCSEIKVKYIDNTVMLHPDVVQSNLWCRDGDQMSESESDEVSAYVGGTKP